MTDHVAAAGERLPRLRFAFGLSRTSAVAELRDLADKLESGFAILQKVSTGQCVQEDDWATYEIAITFAQRNPHFDAAARAVAQAETEALQAELDRQSSAARP